VHAIPVVCSIDLACLTVPPRTALRHLAKAHLHRATLAPGDVLDIAGANTTSAARTILDVAREHGVDAGVAAGDAALHGNLVTPSDLGRALEQCAGWPGRAAARRTVALCDGRAESALESLSRLRMHAARLPAPVLQAELGDEFGRFVARVDFYWPEFGVVGEADGNLKYDSRASLVAERRRQSALEQLGLVVVRWEWRDLRRFEDVARRLRAAFELGVARGAGQRWSHLSLCTRDRR
jgi:very-short-patch-repair endonuclease